MTDGGFWWIFSSQIRRQREDHVYKCSSVILTNTDESHDWFLSSVRSRHIIYFKCLHLPLFLSKYGNNFFPNWSLHCSEFSFFISSPWFFQSIFLLWCQLCPWMHPSNAPNLPHFCGVEHHHRVPNTDTGHTQTSPLNVRICFVVQSCCRQFLEMWMIAARNHPISVMG